MDIEQRLRSELVRSSRETEVSSAPAIGELASVANKRRQRNRVLGVMAAVVVFGAIGFGAILGTQSSDSSLEVADGGIDQTAEDATDSAAAPSIDQPAETEAVVEGAAPVEEAPLEAAAEASSPQEPTEAPVDAEPAVEATTEISGVSRSLQIDQSPVRVESRASAVSLAAGSGVLVVPVGSSGYGGLATRFGQETSCLLYTSPSPRDQRGSRMPSSA